MIITLHLDKVCIYNFTILHRFLTQFADMLGFKLEMPQHEGNLKEKVRPIYLDMQVSVTTFQLDPGH